jgi:DNA-binding CsgD family transcriptional regulator/tetratricopeptide (TPR) repeat protein
MSMSVVSPVFVGRQEEIASLTALLDRVQGGEPAFVLIGGEAGVGKTRLLGELAAQAGRAGFTVLLGHCIELGAEGLPLAPLVDALRALTRAIPADELAQVVGPAAPGLARLLPELSPDPPARMPAEGIQSAQLLELVLGLLGRLSAVRPVLLVLEDLHWADQSTLELVAFLVRSLRAVRVLLVGTYRSDELHRRHPLRPLLTGWERVRTVDRVELLRFQRNEVATQLAAILAAEPGPGLVDLVFDRSGGNAYLVEELAGVVRRGGNPADLPPSLVDVLLSGVDSLSVAAQRLLRTAAVAGKRVPERLLAEVAGLDEAELFAALREAVESHLLVVDQTAPGYEFRHALTRDALYEDMLPGERVRLHAAYGETLAREPGLAGDDTGVAAALAHHWYAALDLPRALPASVSAGQAMTSYAPAEAQRHLERALEIWPRVADAEERTGLDQAEVVRLAADAAYQAGAVDRSVALFDQALADLPNGRDSVRRALVMERRALALRDSGREMEAIAELERALALLPPGQVTRAHAVVLASLAGALLRTSEAEAAIEVAERAVVAARAAGAPEEEADASISLGLAHCYLGSTDEGPEAIRSGLALALAHNVPITALRGYVNLSDVLELRGAHAEAAEVAREGLLLAERVGMVRALGAYLIGNLAEPLLRLGRWAEVDGLLAQALSTVPEGIFGGTVLQLRAERAVMSGRYGAAEADLRAARGALGGTTDVQFILPLGYITAAVALGRGDLAAARAAVSECLPAGAFLWAARYTWPLLWVGMRTEADEAVRAGDRREAVPEYSAARHRVLAALAADLLAVPPTARAYRAMFEAEQARFLGCDDPQLWSVAVTAWEAAQEPYPLAYAWLRRAEAESAVGDRPAATRSVRQAGALAGRIGAEPIAAEAAALARRARLELDGGPGGPAANARAADDRAAHDRAASDRARPSAPDVPAGAAAGEPVDELARFGLTDREREVLLLLADGRSNPEIAQLLFISPKTASVHVSNILAKLGVGGRVEAAAVVHRLGMTGTS